MTPEQQQAVADYFADAEAAILGTGKHDGHTLSQVGRCVYCSCGLRVGQGKATAMRELRRAARRPPSYWEAHATVARPAGDRTPSGQ